MSDNTSYHPDYTDKHSAKTKSAHVIAITSGKGGVGKTNIATNIAIALASRNASVCIFDADTNLANINILLGLNPVYTLEHLLNGEKNINEILMEGPRGIQVVPAASGIAGMASLKKPQRQKLITALEELEKRFDYLLIDTAAGIGDTVQAFIQSAQHTLVVISPEPTSLTDAFSLIKVLKRRNYNRPLYVIVNMVLNYENSMDVFNRFEQAVKKYLNTDLNYIGYITLDEAVISSVRLQQPVVVNKPDSEASQCISTLATHIIKKLGQKDADNNFSAYWKDFADDALIPRYKTNSDVTDTFISEGMEILNTCESILQYWNHNLHDLEQAEKIQQELRMLKDGAHMSDVYEISDLCRNAILLLDSLNEEKITPTIIHSDAIHRTLQTISNMLISIQHHQAPEINEDLIDELNVLRMNSKNITNKLVYQTAPPPENESIAVSAEKLLRLLQEGTDNLTKDEAEKHIQPLIEAFITQYNQFPLNIRKSLYRYLEMQNFPDNEIRDLIFTLESLYEKRYQRPVREIDDRIINVLSEIHGSKEKTIELTSQLRKSYRRQFNEDIFDPINELLDKINQEDFTENQFDTIMESLKHTYRNRFDKDYEDENDLLLKQARDLTKQMMKQEQRLHEDFIQLSESFSNTVTKKEDLSTTSNPDLMQNNLDDDQRD
ncbi:MAG: P-loop NTPase [Gammaproteobacteria bacterium]|nr:P-loop NTPase [Gammaproteobacteria bacterium]